MNWSRSIRSFRAPCKTGICVDLRQEYEMAEKLIFEVGDIVKLKKAPSLRQSGVGDPPGRSGLPPEVSRVRAPDHDREKACGEKHKRFEEKSLK